MVGSAYKTVGGSWTAISDRRLKRDIEPYADGLESLMKVEPVWFTYNDKLGELIEGRTYVGVIAQDMQEVAPYMVQEEAFFRKEMEMEDGSIEVLDPGENYLTYDGSALTYMLVNAVKEQQGQIEEKDAAVEQLENKVDQLSDQVAQLMEMMTHMDNSMSNCCTSYRGFEPVSQPAISNDKASLMQNIPNPFGSSTLVKFYLPQDVQSSSLHFYDISGVELSSRVLNTKGHGQVIFNDAELASGTYFYSLVVDGEVLDTKRMVLLK